MKTGSVVLAVAISLVAGGCAAPNQGAKGVANESQVCNPAVVGIGAALACGLLAGGKNRATAAAACAAAAVTACYLANSYKAEQMRTAKQVEDEYLQRNRNLPERTVVTAYDSRVNPLGSVSRGQKVTLISSIVVVQGRTDRGDLVVEEELKIVDSQGETWGKPVRKTANTANQGGEYQTSFTIPIGDQWSQGVYKLQRTLYVNGAVARRDDENTRFQVVQGPVGPGLVAVAGR